MKSEEIKEALRNIRPDKPHKTEGRRAQQAIDEACAIIDKYEDLLRLITSEQGRGNLS